MAGRDSDDGNGRVTMALLGQQQAQMLAMLQEIRSEQKAERQDITALQQTDVALSGRIDRTNDRISLFSAGQGVLSVMLSALAAWLGVRN